MYGMGHLRTGKNNPMYGKSLTKEHKEKMSKSLTGQKHPMASIKLSKPVIQIDVKTKKEIKKFKSMTQAYESTNILHIGEVCNGDRKTAGGFIWVWDKKQKL